VTRRFTAAHELGHFVLHPHVGSRRLHRERPVNGPRGDRPLLEQEADYFAACLLMPRRAVIDEFSARFVKKHPLPLTEVVAYHLKADVGLLFSQRPGSMLFAQSVARAEQFDTRRFQSLADFFGVSSPAMGIRLTELGLVAGYP
jgi:Zn-dependent peptidase ImmA (M78 family)